MADQIGTFDEFEDEEYEKEPDTGGMPDEEFREVVSSLVQDAEAYIDEDVAPQREAATAYYRGDPLGNEEEGRSKIVSTDVRDVVQKVLPSLMRIFAGSERAVEFQPTTEEEVEMAENATDYVNHLFEKNGGFKVLWNSFKDALVRKTGVITWWVEEKESVREFEDYGFTQDMIALLAQQEGVEIVEIESDSEEAGEGELPTPAEADPATMIADPTAPPALGGPVSPMAPGLPAMPGLPGLPAMPSPETFTVRYKRRTEEKLIRVAAIPPEEFIISRDAMDEDSAICIGRRREMTVSELVAMGYDRDEIEENMGGDNSVFGVSSSNTERATRNPSIDEGRGNETTDPSLKKVLYKEVYVLVDRDGDGIAERRRVCLLGGADYVLHDEIWEDETPPLAMLCPDPEPHTSIGFSLADQVADIQEIKSNVLRDVSDSLKNSIFPRTVVLEGAANLDDVLNTEIGAVIRVRSQGAVQELNSNFVGQQAYPLIQYFDQVRASRTGISDFSGGLDPEAMQSTTASAISASVNGAQERIELIARIFGEGGLKRMFAALLRLAIRHHRKPMMAKLRNGFQQVNPSDWNPDLPLIVNVGLGRGSDQDRMALMGQVLAIQKELLMSTGLNNPLVGPLEFRNTLSKMLELGGVKDVSKYFKVVDPNWQPPQPEQQPDPQLEMLKMQAQVEVLKAQVAKQEADQKHQRELIKIRLEADLERDKLENERWIKANELSLKYGAQLDEAMIAAQTEARRQDIDQIIAEVQAQQALQSEQLAAQAAQATQAQAGAPGMPPQDPNQGMM